MVISSFFFVYIQKASQLRLVKYREAVNAYILQCARLFRRMFVEENESAVNEEREVRVGLSLDVFIHLGSALQFFVDEVKSKLKQISDDSEHCSVNGTEIEPIRAKR